MIRIKRVYEAAAPTDGRRFLVDRLWPRGFTRDSLAMEAWLKDVAPSNELRRFSGHDPERWPEFRRRYREELDQAPAALTPLLTAARAGDVTLLYAARDTERNNAVALREYLQEQLARGEDEDGSAL